MQYISTQMRKVGLDVSIRMKYMPAGSKGHVTQSHIKKMVLFWYESYVRGVTAWDILNAS